MQLAEKSRRGSCRTRIVESGCTRHVYIQRRYL